MLIFHHTSVAIDSPIHISPQVIIPDFSYTFFPGRIYCILGHNGSGKSSLALSLLAHPRYSVGGSISYMGQVLPDTPYSRSLLGIFLSFQNVPEIPGVSCAEYLRNVYLAHTAHVSADTKPMTPYVFRRYIEKLCTELSLAHTFLDRDIYVGFSGGEKRKLELLQARILDPQVLVFDEIDSGMDIDTLQILTREIETLKSKWKCIIVISHNFHLLDTLVPDEVLVLEKWILVTHGDKDIIQDIRERGFGGNTSILNNKITNV